MFGRCMPNAGIAANCESVAADTAADHISANAAAFRLLGVPAQSRRCAATPQVGCMRIITKHATGDVIGEHAIDGVTLMPVSVAFTARELGLCETRQTCGCLHLTAKLATYL